MAAPVVMLALGAGCAPLPQVPGAADPAARGPWPVLLPLPAVLDQVAPAPDEAGAVLDARAAALRARADALR